MTGATTQLPLHDFISVFISRFQGNNLNTIGRKSRLHRGIIFILFKGLHILKVLPVVFRVAPGKLSISRKHMRN
jgi:hypothetical protein